MPRTKPARFRVRLDYRPMAAQRRYAGVSQRALAEAIGVDTSTIHRIETNRREPSASTLASIAIALGVPSEKLIQPVEWSAVLEAIRDLYTVVGAPE